MDLTQVLPEEILADVLRRVAPRGLAVCRCACKALLAVIDARRLLRGDLLPLSVGGVFINFYCEHINYNGYLKERKDLIEGGEDTEYMEYLKENKLELNSGKEQLVEEKFEWDSENDNILHKEDVVDARGNGYFDILGFHPYKEIAFLGVSMYRGIAYHLKYSKVQDLGYLYPTTCHLALQNECFITVSFPYTPCLTGYRKRFTDCSGNNIHSYAEYN
ncbi:hypothetical protein TRIUR3_03588 [Triticum urartu]|uniref:F-box domain-containing protein n=1 Tax=Triticum urartu TaxID=4572 RepID=M7ZR11_TRIUA|nr:hypothetical protein TRIUR3_03588 [Triticum urartu]